MSDESLFVPVFLTESLEEVERVAQELEVRGIPCMVDREVGHGYAELTDHLTYEDAPCYSASVPEEHEGYARHLLEELAFISMSDPAQFISQPRPWVRRVQRVFILSWLLFMGGLLIYAVLYWTGVIG